MALSDLLTPAQAVPQPTHTPAKPPRSKLDPRSFAGLGLAVLLAVVATGLGTLVPAVGAVPFGIALGIALAAIAPQVRRFSRGFKFSSSTLLQLAVVLLGARLSLSDVARVGLQTLPVMLGTLAVCLGAAYLLIKWLDIPRRLGTLIGVGTGICGATAIAAVAPIIGATAAEITYAVSTIFVFNIAALFVFPIIGHAAGMDMTTFGIFAGTAVNDTSSVVATAASFGLAAMNVAVVVKLVRTLMIVPITMSLAAMEARRASQINDDRVTPLQPATTSVAARFGRGLKLIPTFLIVFLLVVVTNSTGIIPGSVGEPIGQISSFLITVALCGIGLGTDFASLRKTGWKPLGLGAILWVCVTVSALGILALSN